MRVLAQRLGRGDFYGVVSRFACGRRAYSRIQWLRQRSDGLGRGAASERSRIVPEHEIDRHVENVRRDGFSRGISLPAPWVDRIYRHATKSPCRGNGIKGNFLSSDIRAGRLPTGELVLNAVVDDDGAPCEVVKAVAHDAAMVKIAERYLGYVPSKIAAELKWSFHSDIPVAEQWERGYQMQDRTHGIASLSSTWATMRQRIRYLTSAKESLSSVYLHYDVFGYNTVRAYFYITDVTRESGAHVTIKRSHRKKSIRMLLSPGIYPEERLRTFYGEQNQDVIEGPAGSGFFEDVACYHKQLPPTRADRLILAVTYT